MMCPDREVPPALLMLNRQEHLGTKEHSEVTTCAICQYPNPKADLPLACESTASQVFEESALPAHQLWPCHSTLTRLKVTMSISITFSQLVPVAQGRAQPDTRPRATNATGEHPKPQEERGIANKNIGASLFLDLKSPFPLFWVNHCAWKPRVPQASAFLSAVSFLTPGWSTPCLPETLCKWNFGFINHRLFAPGCKRVGLLCSKKNLELLSQIQTTGENSSI